MARPSGVPSVNRRKLLAMLREDFGAGYHPVKAMAEIAHNKDAPLELQGRMHAEVANYVCPKLKAVEVTGEGGGPLKLKISWGAASND